MNYFNNKYSLKAVILFLFVLLMNVNATGEELIESAAVVDFYIDPGHGGQYFLNPCGVKTCVLDVGYGYDTCADGYYCEKHINLEVAILIKMLIDASQAFSYVLSRIGDSSITPQKRALRANQLRADAFVSIHHNGGYLYDGAKVLYSTCETDPVEGVLGATSNTSDTLAMKLLFRIDQDFNKADDEDRLPDDGACNYSVLSRTLMPSAITEAADVGNVITNIGGCDQANKLHVNEDNCKDKEAMAIYEGMLSYHTGQGIGRVDYHYNRLRGYNGTPVETQSPEPIVYVDTVNWDIPERAYEVPFQTCWLLDEYVRLEAKEFVLNYSPGMPNEKTYNYTFHHWERKWYTTDWNLETYFTKKLWFRVPYDFEGDHYYVAYFTGGPYEIEIISEPIPDVYVGDEVSIRWTVDAGVDSTTVVVVQASDDSINWVVIDTVPYLYYAYDYTSNWIASGLGADCYIKLVATDTIGNRVSTLSNSFSITDLSIDPDGDFIIVNDNCPNDYNPDQYNSDGDA